MRRGVVETSNLKVKLEEIKDSLSHNGVVYNDCPVLRILMLKVRHVHLKELIALKAFEMEFLKEGESFSEEVEDLEAFAVTHPSLPALGVIKMNITGKVRNYKIKMGFDLK